MIIRNWTAFHQMVTLRVKFFVLKKMLIHPPFTIIILCFFFLLKSSSKVEKKNNQLLLLKKKKKKYKRLSCPMRILSLFTVLTSPQNCFSSIKRWTLKTIVVGLSFAYGPSEYKVFHSNFVWKSNFRF